MIRRLLVASLFAILSTIATDPASAAPAGEAVKVTGSVSASGPEGTRALITGGPVYMGDTIDTGAGGEAQIRFTDDTKLAIAPGSRLAIDAYVVRSPGTVRRFAVNAARGAFRMISGNSRSSAYSVRTPTATIGVRGTGFDVSARKRRQSAVLLYDGALAACNTLGRCITINDPCEMAIIVDEARPMPHQVVPSLRPSDVSELVPGNIRYRFPYLVDEARLLPEYRVGAARCLGRVGASQRSETGTPEHERPARVSPAITPGGEDDGGEDGGEGTPGTPGE